jgi:hypothetical protein
MAKTAAVSAVKFQMKTDYYPIARDSAFHEFAFSLRRAL